MGAGVLSGLLIAGGVLLVSRVFDGEEPLVLSIQGQAGIELHSLLQTA